MSDENGSPLVSVEIGALEIIEAALRVIDRKETDDAISSFEVAAEILASYVHGPRQMPTDVAAAAFPKLNDLVGITLTKVMSDPLVIGLARSAGHDLDPEEGALTDVHLMCAHALLTHDPDQED